MANYTELSAIGDDANYQSLLAKIAVAVAIKAASVIDEATPIASKLEWAKNTIKAPSREAGDLIYYLIGKNSGLTIANITGASDSAIQTNVDAAIDKFYAS